jgi:hypothetical protein
VNAPFQELPSDGVGAVDWHPGKLRSLWDMLKNYLPIYKIASSLQSLRTTGLLLKGSRLGVHRDEVERFRILLDEIRRTCLEYDLAYTSDMAKRISDRAMPQTYEQLFPELDHLSDSLSHELGNEAVFQIPSGRKDYFERDDLFGPKVAAAFPSCERDIRKAGSCYALEQEDACVHHLMLVLERGLNALGGKVGVSFHYADWKKIIDHIDIKLKSGLPRGPELDFYRHVNAQFGFLKEAYRKHSAHARDDPYDMPKALSILNHVRDFMQELEKGGLSE